MTRDLNGGVLSWIADLFMMHQFRPFSKIRIEGKRSSKNLNNAGKDDSGFELD